MSAADVNENWVSAPDAVITPDDVRAPGKPAAVPAVPDPVEAAINRAASEALAAPGFADRDEFNMMCLKARMISLAELAPKDLRGNPYNCLMVLMKGRALGIDEATAIEDVYVIEGRTSVAPRLQVALVQRRGLGDVVPHPNNSRTWAAAIPLNTQGQPIGDPVVFEWDDAVDAELVDPECGPDPDRPGRIRHHTRPVQRNRRGGGTYTAQVCRCKDNYRKYGDDMLYWRAVAKCTRRYFSQVGIGAYQPDELGAVTDDEGNPIDVTSVELPPGYEDPGEIQQARQEAAREQTERPADPDVLWALQERVRRLPPEWRAKLREAWDDEGSNAKGFSLACSSTQTRPLLPHRKLGVARALVNAWEGEARKAGVDLDAELAALRGALGASLVGFLCWGGPPRTEQPPESPQTAPDDQPAPDTHADAPQAASDDEGHASDETSGDAPPTNPESDVDRPDGDEPEQDWRPAAKEVSAMLTAACVGVPDNVIQRVAHDVKALHWSKVNAELDEAGIPTDEHIDLRRMRVSLLRLRAFRTSQQMDNQGEPDGQP